MIDVCMGQPDLLEFQAAFFDIGQQLVQVAPGSINVACWVASHHTMEQFC